MLNSHLMQKQEGQPFQIQVDFGKNVSIGGGGYIPPGVYLARINVADVVPKKSGDGMTSKFEFQTVGPDRWAGKKITDYGPAPIGGDDPEDTAYEYANRMWAQYYISQIDVAGGTDFPQTTTTMESGHYVGQTVCIRIADEVTKGSRDNKPFVVSRVRGVALKAEYDKNPGPYDPNATGERPDPASVAKGAGAGAAPTAAASAIAAGVATPAAPPASVVPTPPTTPALPVTPASTPAAPAPAAAVPAPPAVAATPAPVAAAPVAAAPAAPAAGVPAAPPGGVAGLAAAPAVSS